MLSSSAATNASLVIAIEFLVVAGGQTPRLSVGLLERSAASEGSEPRDNFGYQNAMLKARGLTPSKPCAGIRWGARPSGQVRRSLGELSARRLTA